MFLAIQKCSLVMNFSDEKKVIIFSLHPCMYHACPPQAAFNIFFSFFFGFQDFNCAISRCGFHFNYPSWGVVRFLDLCNNNFEQIWKNFSQMFFSSILPLCSFWDPNYIHGLLDTVLQIFWGSVHFYQYFFLFCLIWIIAIHLSSGLVIVFSPIFW